MMGGADVAVGGRGNEDLVALRGVFCQSSCAHGLDVIGMCANCENIHTIDSFLSDFFVSSFHIFVAHNDHQQNEALDERLQRAGMENMVIAL